MLNRIIVTGLFLLILSPVFTQSLSDSIVVTRGLSTRFWHKGKPLTVRQLLDITKTNKEAYNRVYTD